MRNKVSVTAQFDKRNPNWAPHAEYNLIFLRTQENYLNNLLAMRGFLVLNDVLNVLGFKLTREGMVLGWTAGEQITFFDPNHVEADHIPLTFEVRDIYNEDEGALNG